MEFAKYLIIGNGIAGHSASTEIRKADAEGSILILSREPHHTYYRLKLTEMIAHPIEDKDLFITTSEKAQENKIEIALDTVVSTIDTKEKTVRAEDGREWKYEKLLLATGAGPFIPPTKGEDKENVLSIRTLDDIRDLERRFASAERIVVVGGGLLGLEAAWALHEIGKRVDVVEMAPWLLPRQLDEPSSAKLMASLAEAGLKIHTGASVAEIVGDGTVEGVMLNDETLLPADGVLFNIGVRPNTSLAGDAGIAVGRGIQVDDHMKTEQDDVYAAGDCIELGGMVFGLWTQSNAQGKVAGKNMSGGDAAYDRPKLFSNLKLGDIQLFSSGDVQNFDEVREYQNDTDSFKKFFFKDGKVVGGILYGNTKDMGKVNQMIDGTLDFEQYKQTSIDE